LVSGKSWKIRRHEAIRMNELNNFLIWYYEEEYRFLPFFQEKNAVILRNLKKRLKFLIIMNAIHFSGLFLISLFTFLELFSNDHVMFSLACLGISYGISLFFYFKMNFYKKNDKLLWDNIRKRKELMTDDLLKMHPLYFIWSDLNGKK